MQKTQHPIFNLQSSISKCGKGPRRGFTLIEVLAAMAVLVILVLALTRMFVEAMGISKRGTTTLMRNSTAETVMETIRKGRNNSVTAGPTDVGSPWAIGSDEGGHDDRGVDDHRHRRSSSNQRTIWSAESSVPVARFRSATRSILCLVSPTGFEPALPP